MKIGLDFDGVISDSGKLKSRCARILFGVEIPGGLFKKEIVLANRWLTSAQYDEVTRAVYYSKEFGSLIEPVEGALSYVPRLFRDGHELLVITSRLEIDLEIAREWARRRNLALRFAGVGLGAGKAKAATGLDVYVDDDLHKLEPLVGVVPHLFLFSWGYNRHLDAAQVAVRVSSWEDLYRRIAAIAKIPERQS